MPTRRPLSPTHSSTYDRRRGVGPCHVGHERRRQSPGQPVKRQSEGRPEAGSAPAVVLLFILAVVLAVVLAIIFAIVLAIVLAVVAPIAVVVTG